MPRDPYADHADPHIDDGLGPMPRIPPGFRRPVASNKTTGVFIWPRDKNRGTWGRVKDLFTGKGPDIWLGRSDAFAPTRADWSNWIDPGFDSLGYRDEHDKVISTPRPGRYDFKSRRYVTNWAKPGVWSNVKWERGKNPKMPLYWRDGLGHEFTQRWGVQPTWYPWLNDFRYNQQTPGMDWAAPEPRPFWDFVQHGRRHN